MRRTIVAFLLAMLLAPAAHAQQGTATGFSVKATGGFTHTLGDWFKNLNNTGSSFDVTGVLNLGGGGGILNLNGGTQTYSGSSITQPVLNVTSVVGGATNLTGTGNVNLINCAADTGVATGTSFIQCLKVGYGFGGSTVTGNRAGLVVDMSFGATSGNKAAGNNPFYQSVGFTTNMNATDGGTGLTLSTGWGQAFGGSATMAGNSSATNFLETSIWEDDMFFQGTTARRMGHKVVDLSTGPQAPVTDAAFIVEKNLGATGWRDAYAVGGGIVQFPINGTMLHADLGNHYVTSPNSVAYGVDMVGITCTAECWRSNGIALLDAGAARFNTLYVVNDTSGPTLDAKGSVGAFSAVVAGGSSGWAVDNLLTGPYDDVWKVTTVSGGVITGLALASANAPPYCGSSCPASYNLTGLSWTVGAGTVTVGVTWTAKSTLTLNSSGGATNLGGTLLTSGAATFVAGATTVGTSVLQVGSGANNQLYIVPQAPGGTPSILLGGPDTDVGLNITLKGAGKLSSSGGIVATAYTVGATAGVTCSGSPTSSFASVNGIVTHC